MVRAGRFVVAFPQRIEALADGLEYNPPLASVDACVQTRAHDQTCALEMQKEIGSLNADVLVADGTRGCPPSCVIFLLAAAAEPLLSGNQYCSASQAIAIDDGGVNVVSTDA